MMKVEKIFEHIDDRGTFCELHRGGNWQEINSSTVNNGYARGGHYHKKTEELILVVSGKCEFKTIDMRNKNENVFVCEANEGVIVYPFEKHFVNALEDSKLISLLSMPYDKNNPDNFIE